MKSSRKLILVIILFSTVQAASAIDLNSSTSLRYFPDSSQEFGVDTEGNTDINGELNITDSGTTVADFSQNQIKMHQPLSIESSGALSVANGIDLTDSSSNTIDSYSTFYLQTSSGSASDIVLQPTGVTDIDSNVTVRGNIDLDNNEIRGLSDPTDPQDAATRSYVNSNDDTIQDNQGLEEVLSIDNNVGGENINFNETSNIQSDGTNAITLDSSQNIGIPNGRLGVGGSPQSALEVSGENNFSIRADVDSRSSKYDAPQFVLRGETTDVDNNAVNNVLGRVIFASDRTSASKGGAAAIEAKTMKSDNDEVGLDFYVQSGRFAGDERMHAVRFDESGKVGIGTKNPSSKLEVAGDGAGVIINDDGSGSQYPTLRMKDRGNQRIRIQWRDGNPERLTFVDEWQGTGELLNLYNSDGRVEIPSGNLDMNGNNINDIGTSNVDMVHDSSDDRVEMRSNGEEDICIGNCGT